MDSNARVLRENARASETRYNVLCYVIYNDSLTKMIYISEIHDEPKYNLQFVFWYFINEYDYVFCPPLNPPTR